MVHMHVHGSIGVCWVFFWWGTHLYTGKQNGRTNPFLLVNPPFERSISVCSRISFLLDGVFGGAPQGVETKTLRPTPVEQPHDFDSLSPFLYSSHRHPSSSSSGHQQHWQRDQEKRKKSMSVATPFLPVPRSGKGIHCPSVATMSAAHTKHSRWREG